MFQNIKLNTEMREIKFRGKSKDTGKWVFGYLEYNRAKNIARIHTYDEDGNYERQHEVNIETVGQYTGLRDKNGREIYEGDILGADNKVIGWIEGGVRGYCYDVVYIKKDVNESPIPVDERWSLYSTVQYDYPNRIEVIGSIHDNPELMDNKYTKSWH